MIFHRISQGFKALTFREKVAIHLVFLIPLLFCLITSFLFTPDDFEQRRGIIALCPKCSYKIVTGRPCFTCGLTRAFTAISHGDFERAKTYHSGALIWYTVFVIAAVAFSVSYILLMINYYNNNKAKKKGNLHHERRVSTTGTSTRANAASNG